MRLYYRLVSVYVDTITHFLAYLFFPHLYETRSFAKSPGHVSSLEKAVFSALRASPSSENSRWRPGTWLQA